MTGLIWWVAVPVGLALAGLAYAWLKWWRYKVVWVNPERKSLLAYKCPTCDGTGLQWFDPDYEQWMPIPERLRMHSKNVHGQLEVNPRLANTRMCPHCLGMLHFWDTPY